MHAFSFRQKTQICHGCVSKSPVASGSPATVTWNRRLRAPLPFRVRIVPAPPPPPRPPTLDPSARGMECLTEEQAFAYLTLSETALPAQAVQSHLDTCATCRIALAETARALAEG